jgi:hypothetical protein
MTLLRFFGFLSFLPGPFARLRRRDFRLHAADGRVYVTPLTCGAAAWLGRRIASCADAEWSGGSLVLGNDGASAFIDAVRRDGLEVAR